MSGLKIALLSMAKHLQDEDLRVLRGRTHDVFDQLWKDHYMTRTEAYEWMQEELQLKPEQAHIAVLSREQCIYLMSCVDTFIRYYGCDATEADIY